MNRTMDLVGNMKLRGMWLGEDLRTDPKRHMFERERTACSKHASHPRLGSKHKLGEPIQPLRARQ